MGNCVRTSKVSAQDHERYEAPVEEAKVEHIKTSSSSSSSSSSKLEAPLQEQSMKKKVRFKTQKDIDEGDNRGSHGNSRSGAVRIRVVMTQEELKRMLSCNNDAQHKTLEQLLSAVKLRRGRIYEVGEYDRRINSWRPSLESIPEDRLIK